MDWNGLAHELKSFQATSPEELEDGLNYMASRYVAALDKLERNGSSRSFRLKVCVSFRHRLSAASRMEKSSR